MQPKLAHSNYYKFPVLQADARLHMLLYLVIILHWWMCNFICKLTVGSEGLQGAALIAPSQVPPCCRCCCWQGHRLVQAQGRTWPCCWVALIGTVARIVLPANRCTEHYSCIYVKPLAVGQVVEKTATFTWVPVTALQMCSYCLVSVFFWVCNTFLLVEVKKHSFFLLSADTRQFLRNLSGGSDALLAAILCVSNM